MRYGCAAAALRCKLPLLRGSAPAPRFVSSLPTEQTTKITSVLRADSRLSLTATRGCVGSAALVAPRHSNMAPKDEPQDMKHEAALLEAFAEIPTVAAAWLRNAGRDRDGPLTLTVQSVQRNVAANAQRKFLTTFSLPRDYAGQPLQPTFPVELKDVLLLSVSPSGARTLVVRGGGDKASAMLEVWGGGRLLRDLSVPAPLHGAVYNDGWFAAGAAWSPDEQRIAYVAEVPSEVQTPLWGNSAAANGEEPSGEAAKSASGEAEGNGADKDGGEKDKGGEGAAPKTWRGVASFQEDWGELNIGKRQPALFVLDTATWKVAAVRGLPPGATAGQPVWTPSGETLICVVWPHAAPNFPAFPQRLGIVYCFNRPCALYAVAVPGSCRDGAGSEGGASEAVRLTQHSQLQSAFAPRFVAGSSRLLFLSQHAACVSGVHNGTTSVHSLPWSAQGGDGAAAGEAAGAAAREVVAVVERPEGSAFPGLYTAALLPQPVAGDWVVVGTQWRDVGAIVAVDVEARTGPVRLTPPDGASWSLLDCWDGWVAAARSHPGAPPAVYLARMPWGAPEEPLPWTAVTADDRVDFDSAVGTALADIQVDTIQVRPQEGSPGGAAPLEAVVVRPSSAPGPLPAVVLPHGGPHAAYTRSYMLPTAFLPALGYAVIAPNFRGSTGYGEDCIQALPGHAGVADVADCMAALTAAIEKGSVDPGRVAVVGGSHGGFLAGHLAGQHPAAFRAAVLRNPVLDLSVMVHLSDIPDWCYVEAWGGEEGLKRMAARPTREDLDHFRAVSPIAHVGAVQAAMLFMLGAKDRRVPSTDAQLYVRALAARGEGAPEVRTIVFPEDTHALDRPQTEFEQWITTASWLKTHLAPSPT